MSIRSQNEAENFLNKEKQFHLGMLPTEQSNPKTRDIDLIFTANQVEGVRKLLSVDCDIQPVVEKVLKGNEFRLLIDSGINAVAKGRKIIFSGCGSTGRLGILLESMWRGFFRDMQKKNPEVYDKIKKFENSVFSIMTGGDYALIRSVESFEDYQEFGKQQVREMKVGQGDVLVAITEGGETSSVLGTAKEAIDKGAKVFLMLNNPVDILCNHIYRSRQVIEDPRVTVLDLYCGPMAIAGSTRMQATTTDLLVAGIALEMIISSLLTQTLEKDNLKMLNVIEPEYSVVFNSLLDELLSSSNLQTLAEFIKMEVEIYKSHGLVTYYANDLLLDIFTDTTERSPTFMVPPFKKVDNPDSPSSWAFVKNPLRNTPETWKYMLGRDFRCLDWNRDLYTLMNAPLKIISDPPKLDQQEIIKFLIGNEEDSSRTSKMPNMAICIISARERMNIRYKDFKIAFESNSLKYQRKSCLIIGNCDENIQFQINCSPANSFLNLMEHVAVKLVLNTISTGTMILMGRVSGNWMSWVDVTNKKLKDRGIRLISEICNLSYRDACCALHESIEKLNKTNFAGKERPSPVQYTISQLRK